MVDGDEDKEDDGEFKPKSDDDEGEEENNDEEVNEDEDEDEEGSSQKGMKQVTSCKAMGDSDLDLSFFLSLAKRRYETK